MRVGAPHERNGITDRGVQGERHEAKNALGRGNDDGVRGTSSDAAAGGSGLIGSRGKAAVGSNAF